MSKISVSTIIKSIQMEPIMFLTTFLFSFRGLKIVELYQEKICLNISDIQNCKNLLTHDEILKKTIIGETNVYKLYDNLLWSIPSIFLSLFAGNWIDKFRSGIRFIVIVNAFGKVIESILSVVISYYTEG